MNNYEDISRIAEELKKFVSDFDITIITAHQSTPNGYRTPPKFDDVIVVDYMGFLK